MSTPDPTVLAWMDLETTGLNPHRRHNLLEVACVLTDAQLNEIPGTEFHRVLYYPESAIAGMRDRAGDYVAAMHDKTGLWDRLPHGTERQDVERDLLALIQTHAPEPRSAALAGSSVKLDFDFTTFYLPDVAKHLHYRVLDVTSVRLFLEGSGLATSTKTDKEPAHEAMADIRASIAEARDLRDQLAAVRAAVGEYRERWSRSCTAQANMQRTAQSIMDERNTAVGLLAPVHAAWTVEGPAPHLHQKAQRKLRQDWPALAGPLDALATALVPTKEDGRG